MARSGRLPVLIALMIATTACAVTPTPRPTQSEGFAIYLVASSISPADVLDADLGSLALADKPLITGADLVRYSRTAHTLQLTPEAYGRVKALAKAISGPPFVVCVDRTPVYSGSFWTSLSSASYAGIVIDTLRPGDDINSLRVQLGYPEGPGFFRGEDRRADPRIMQALAAAGKLE